MAYEVGTVWCSNSHSTAYHGRHRTSRGSQLRWKQLCHLNVGYKEGDSDGESVKRIEFLVLNYYIKLNIHAY